MAKVLVGVMALALSLVACTSGGAPTGSSEASTSEPSLAAAPTEAPMPTQIVDASLRAESRSALSAGAKEALTACGLLESLDIVSGIAELPRAADAPRYANIWGTPPYLVDRPAWLITTTGEIFLRTSTGIDPTCLVVDGEATWLYTNGSIENGKVVEPLERNPDLLALPPLKP